MKPSLTHLIFGRTQGVGIHMRPNPAGKQLFITPSESRELGTTLKGA